MLVVPFFVCIYIAYLFCLYSSV
ncbi:MAG: hypothetical protein IK131_03190 [Paludibacteraceae bacterium]|nr:hypothetical protein [Paludibacteraceae bacterium]